MNRPALFEIACRATKSAFGAVHQVVASSVVLALETGSFRGVPENRWEALATEAVARALASLKAAFRTTVDPNAVIPLLLMEFRAVAHEEHHAAMRAEQAEAAAAIAEEEANRAKVQMDREAYEAGRDYFGQGRQLPNNASPWFVQGYGDAESAAEAKGAADKAAAEEARLEAEAAAMRAEAALSIAAPPSPKPPPANPSMASKSSRPKAQG